MVSEVVKTLQSSSTFMNTSLTPSCLHSCELCCSALSRQVTGQMFAPPQPRTNATGGLGFLERVMFSTMTLVPCCMFLFINGTMLFTLRSKPVFREACRYILLCNLLFADTVQLAQSQILYLLSIFRVMLTYPLCGIFFMIAKLTTEISPLTLVLMSVERYVAVCRPLRHAAIVTIRNTVAAVIIIWAFCLLNVLIQVLLLLEFPFEELESLQMRSFCSIDLMFLTPGSYNYDRGYTCFLFVSAGVVTVSAYIGVVIAARSASADKASARKARNTLLLHLVQLGLSLSSTVQSPLLLFISQHIPLSVLLRIQNVFYVVIIILPRCMSSLIYGLRDQTIRPVLMYNLCCQNKLTFKTLQPRPLKAKVKDMQSHLQLNVSKMREMVVDFRRNKPLPSPVSISGTDVDLVDSYKCLGVTLDNNLDWSTNTQTIYKKGLCGP
ncbi:odorant receptor 131-2-like [Xenentodon cancila]